MTTAQPQSSEEHPLMTHEQYLHRRDELLRIRADSFGAFDKTVLSLATGSLALTITFLEKIGAPYDCATLVLISAAWLAFLLVLLANLISYHFARANMDQKIKALDAKYRKEGETAKADDSPEEIFWQKKATSWCNLVALVLFCVGAVCFMAYVTKIQLKRFDELKSGRMEDGRMAEDQQAPAEGNPKPSADVTKGQVEAPQAAPPIGPKLVTAGQVEAPQAALPNQTGDPASRSGPPQAANPTSPAAEAPQQARPSDAPNAEPQSSDQ